MGVYYALNNSSPNSSFVGKQVSESVMNGLTTVSDSTLAAVGVPTGVTHPLTISGTPLTLNGKPEVLYVGGDYCPYCAVERWSLIVALSHFGVFSNLTYVLSSATDVNPNSPTFSFAGSNYTSSKVAFVGVEEFGSDPSTVRQPLTTQQKSLVSQYDNCPGGSSGGIPFIDIANAYAVSCGAQSLLDISNKNWTEISSQLNNPNTDVARFIDGAANTLISSICKVTGQATYPCNQSYATLSLSQVGEGAGSGVAMAAPSFRPRQAQSL